MLNTIYEEFDFEAKIKDLKNKKIKIKRVVRKDGSMGDSQMIRSSSINKESINPTSKPHMPSLGGTGQGNPASLSGMFSASDIKKSQILDENTNKNQPNQHDQKQQKQSQEELKPTAPPRKKNNALFYSTELNVPSGKFAKPSGDQAPDEDVIADYAIMNPREKNSNPMFMSQDITITRNKQQMNFKTDLQHMLLPQSVTKMLKEEEKNIQTVFQHIQKQKKKVDYEIDAQIREVLDAFNKTRKKLHSQFDEYLVKYRENYEFLKNSVEKFKEKQKEVPTLSGKTVTDLQSIQVYEKNEEDQKLTKVKEEKCKLKTSIENIQREVEKKLMEHFCDQISKATYHLPLFNHSSTSQMLAMEMKVKLIKALDENLCNYEHLVYKNNQANFNNMSVQPQISKVVSQDRFSVIGDFQSKALQLEIAKEFQTGHFDTIMCIYALSNSLIATGGNDGIVEVIDVEKEKKVKQINVQYPVFSLGIFNSESLNLESRKMEEYLVVGGAQVNLFSMTDNQFNSVKKLNMEKHQKIICLQELRDSQTLALGGSEGKIYIHNILRNKIEQVLTDHGASVNCMALTQDGMNLLSASNDRKILVYKLQFEKQVFSNCHLVRTITDQSQVFSLNASLFKSNMVFSGGSDCKIKLWNIQNGSLEREIVGHRSPISQMILFENPFVDMKDGNYQMVSSGTNDEALRISNGICSINNGISLSKKIENNWAAYASPTMQLIRTQNNDLGIVIASQEDKKLFTLNVY